MLPDLGLKWRHTSRGCDALHLLVIFSLDEHRRNFLVSANHHSIGGYDEVTLFEQRIRLHGLYLEFPAPSSLAARDLGRTRSAAVSRFC